MFMAHGATDPDYQYGCETTGPAKARTRSSTLGREHAYRALLCQSRPAFFLEEYPVAICGGALRAAMLR